MPLWVILELFGLAACGWYYYQTKQLTFAEEDLKSLGGAHSREEDRTRKEKARITRDECLIRYGAAFVLSITLLVLTSCIIFFERQFGQSIILLP